MLTRDQHWREELQKDMAQRCAEAVVHSVWIPSFPVHRS